MHIFDEGSLYVIDQLEGFRCSIPRRGMATSEPSKYICSETRVIGRSNAREGCTERTLIRIVKKSACEGQYTTRTRNLRQDNAANFR
jgi:hypothetical protein